MDDYPAEHEICLRYEFLQPVLDERLRRLWAAAEAMALGTPGITILSRVTGLSRSTIRAGIKQLEQPSGPWLGLTRAGRVRKPGAGRKSAVNISRIGIDLEHLMESCESEPGPLVWTCKSLRTLAEELDMAGHPVSYRTVGNLLHRRGYRFGRSGDHKKCSLFNRREGFRRIAETAAAYLRGGEPILSIRFQASPEAVAAAPYLAISGLLSWWHQNGQPWYPQARRMLLISEGAMNGNAWMAPLEALATEVRLEVSMAQFPPGAWRWQRSVLQATGSWSHLEGAATIGASFDLVLPVLEPS
jgi:hypothetical protein